jgi:hypothetical protein
MQQQQQQGQGQPPPIPVRIDLVPANHPLLPPRPTGPVRPGHELTR